MKKILISSDCNDNLHLLLPKIADLHAKNHFDFMLITGNVLPSSSAHILKDLVAGRIKVPLPVYFIDRSDTCGVLATAYPDGGELAPNLHYLGRMGCR